MSGSRISLEALEERGHELVKESLSQSTWNSYLHAVEKFMGFRREFRLGGNWPVDSKIIVLYISYLNLNGYAASTTNVHISALAFVHKINNWHDPTKNFLVGKVREGCRRTSTSSDARCPITLPILFRLIEILPSVCYSQYEALLFKAAFCLAFFGFLRVGEFTCPNKYSFKHTIQRGDVFLDGTGSCIKICIRSSKTDQHGISSSICINRNTREGLCPVQVVTEYLGSRPNIEGAFLVHFNGIPLTTGQFRCLLKKCIGILGLPSDLFSTHSFRIGAATWAAMCGLPNDTVKEFGRWKSSAYERYIRPNRVIPLNNQI